MGVKGLWELLEPIGRRVNIETLTHKRLAVGAGWHPGHPGLPLLSPFQQTPPRTLNLHLPWARDGAAPSDHAYSTCELECVPLLQSQESSKPKPQARRHASHMGLKVSADC